MTGIKKKWSRVRLCPNKRWLPEEEKALSAYLRDNKPFERPSTSIYYNKFLQQCNVGVSPRIIRAKVRNMRMCYYRAKEIREKTDPSTLEGGQSIEDIIKQKCPYYDILDEIFGTHNKKSIIETEQIKEELENSDFSPASYMMTGWSPQNDDAEFERMTDFDSNCSNIDERRNSMVYITNAAENTPQEENIRKENGENSVSTNEFLLKSQQILLEKEKLKQKRELKILELEMKERIAMRELEMRERVAMKKIESKLIKINK